MQKALIGAAMALALTLGTSVASLADSKDTCATDTCKKCVSLCTSNRAAYKKKGNTKLVAALDACISACKKRQKSNDAAAMKACADACNTCATACADVKDKSLQACMDTCNTCAQGCAK